MSLEGPPVPPPNSQEQSEDQPEQLEGQDPPVDTPSTPRPDKIASHEDVDDDDETNVSIIQKSNQLAERRSTVVFGIEDWKNVLSENAQKLYWLLLMDLGDTQYLPLHAAEEGFDLDAALEEIRSHIELDESDPHLIKLPRREL